MGVARSAAPPTQPTASAEGRSADRPSSPAPDADPAEGDPPEGDSPDGAALDPDDRADDRADDQADDREGAPPARLPPDPELVAALNRRVSAASNTKQVRAREAEEDRALIARAQQNDAAAFRQLVERHQRRAFAIALGLVRDENDARELVQDAFLRVYRGLGSFQNNSSFFTWLYRIITNLSIDLIRKPGRQLADIDESRFDAEEGKEAEFPLLSRIDGSDPMDVVRRREIAARVQIALDALPPYHRGVIVMREVEGLSYEEMAQVTGVSKGTIMSRLFHARQKLQKALTDCYEEQIGEVPPSSEDGGGGGGGGEEEQ